MPAYVAFLRAVNLGATRKFPKEAIRAAARAAGFTDVETYINTGNVRVSTPLRSRAAVESALEAAFAADRGFEVPTIAFRSRELAGMAQAGEEIAAARPARVRHYVTLLKREPDEAAARRAVEALARPPGVYVALVGRALHVLPDQVLGGGGPTGAAVERLLGVGTTRNQTVLSELARRWR